MKLSKLLVPIWNSFMSLCDDQAGPDQISKNNQELLRELNLKASENQNVGLPKWKNNLIEDDLKIMDEINTTYKPKTKQWLHQAWYWVRAALAFSVMLGVCYLIASNQIVMDIFTWTFGLGLIGGLIYCFKVLMGVAFKDDGFED